MGLAGSKGGRAVGAAAIDEKLAHLRSHISDTMVTHGLIQEITSVINKNSNGERERFCALLYSASTGGPEAVTSVPLTGRMSTASASSDPPSAAETGLGSSVLPTATGTPLLTTDGGTASGTGPSSSAFVMPFAELFAKVRLMTDAASKTSVIHWMRHVMDSNEQDWTVILVRSQVVHFVVDFYQFQANTHVPPDTLTHMAQLLSKWAVNDEFASTMNQLDAFRGVLVRLKFAQTGSKERSFLLSAMRRCHRSNLSKNDSFDILMKIALERDEAVEQSHVDCLEMIAEAFLQRNDLLQNLSAKQMTSFQRFFSSSSALVASAMKLFVIIAEVEAKLVEASTAGSTVQKAKYFADIIKTLCAAFDVSLIDNMHASPMYLIATSAMCIKELGPDSAVHFVEQKHLQMLIRKSYKSTLISCEQAVRFSKLCQLLLSANPPLLSSKMASAGALHLLIDSITIAEDEASVESIVLAASSLCLADPTVGAALCSDRKLHALMASVDARKQPGEDTQIIVWGIVQLLEKILTPQVLQTADEMLVMTVYSLLCQIMGSCVVPPKRFFSSANSKRSLKAAALAVVASSSPGTSATVGGGDSSGDAAAGFAVPAPSVQSITEKVLQSCLQMLTVRCHLGPSYAESILGQVPLQVLRALVTADHLPHLRSLAQGLSTVLASASMAAMSELSIMGCIADRMDVARRKGEFKITLKRVQRHWKRVLHVRKVSYYRVKMANLLKETFMTRLETAYDESLHYQSIMDALQGNLDKIHRDYEERQILDEQLERSVEVMRRSELTARTTILMQMAEDAEQRFRFKLRIEEQQIRVCVGPQRALSGVECQARSEISAENDKFMDTQFQYHKTKLQELRIFMLKRNAVLDAEQHSRSGLAVQFQSDTAKLYLYQLVMHLSEDERLARRMLSTNLLTQHRDFLRQSFVILKQQIQEDEVRLRGAIEVSRGREYQWLVLFLEQTDMLQQESYHRMEWRALEDGTYRVVAGRFYGLLLKQLEADESRVRSSLMRTVVLDWRAMWLPFERLTAQAHEEVRRRALQSDHKMGFNMIQEAARYMKPIVCQAEELRKRQEIDLQYASFAVAQKWELALYRLVREELAARNAISLQYFFMARNLLAPLMCLRLVNYQYQLLLADLTIRTDLLVEERDEFYLILLAEVRDTQRHFRAVIAEEQSVDHERLAQHFVTVTHVVRLQEQAQDTLTDYAVEQLAMELHSGFKKKKKPRHDRSFVARVKALNATV